MDEDSLPIDIHTTKLLGKLTGLIDFSFMFFSDLSIAEESGLFRLAYKSAPCEQGLAKGNRAD